MEETEIQKLRLTTKQQRELGWNQIYYLRFDKPIILSDTLEESINVLRDIFEPDYSEEKKKEYKLFWEIIAKHQLKKRLNIDNTNAKKESYYKTLRIEMKKRKIERLKKELEKEEQEFKDNQNIAE